MHFKWPGSYIDRKWTVMRQQNKTKMKNDIQKQWLFEAYYLIRRKERRLTGDGATLGREGRGEGGGVGRKTRRSYKQSIGDSGDS